MPWSFCVRFVDIREIVDHHCLNFLFLNKVDFIWFTVFNATSLSPIRHGFQPGFVNYRKGCTRSALASDNVYQLLAHGRWFSPGTPASFTTKTGRHNIAEILLKMALNTVNQIKSTLFKKRKFKQWWSTISRISTNRTQKDHGICWWKSDQF
jgi:hypothetical protein